MSKTILITGSTDGIGKLTARKLAEAGHRVLLHGRNAEKVAAVTKELKTATGNSNLSGFVADLSDLSAVVTFANEVAAAAPALDVLINNAGVYASAEKTSKDGLELRFAVNYVAPLLLTTRLAPALRAQKSSRVINLSSAAQGSVSLPALKGVASLSHRDAYAQSKLALTMWSFQLAQEYPELTVIAVNPGSLLNTKMVREGFGFINGPVDKGADILFALATADQYAVHSGEYFDNDRGGFGHAHPDAYDAALIKQLLQTTQDLLTERGF
ncbi:MAG: SDR family NAD(P)-dependent oxidoreductase [Bacteroidota bacterium]